MPERTWTTETFASWSLELFQRHRFGRDDRMGSLNLIDEQARARAAASVLSGRAVSLARPLESNPAGLGEGALTFEMEFELHELPGGTSMAGERVTLGCHGLGNTHIDALNHISFEREWYGGTQEAAGDALVLANAGVFTRIVHADIVAARDGEPVTLDTPVSGEDLDRALAATDQQLLVGDALLLDMGRDRLEAGGKPWAVDGLRPGVGASGAEWIADHDVGILCWDMQDHIDDREPVGVVHRLLWAIGLILVDNCTFAAYRAAAQRGAQGALVVAPLALASGTGTNINPLALF